MFKNLAATLLVLLLASVSSAEIVIDFESLEREDADFQTVGSTFVEDGFLLSEGNGGELGNVGTLEPRFTGSTAVAGSNPNSLYVLTRVAGGSFGVDSIDLAGFSTTEGGTAAVTFTGILTAGGITTQTFTLNASGFVPQTFNFDSSFDSVVGLVWLQSSPAHQFDNIGLTVIPEPSAGIAMIAVLALGFRRRK